MADALCGPSNALQNFKSHTSADRSLQQDRLRTHQSPLQGFRSADPRAGALDGEFAAFQSAQPQLPSFNEHAPLLRHSPVPERFGPQPGPSTWANDFQRLSLQSSPVSYAQRQFVQKPQPQTSRYEQELGRGPVNVPQTYSPSFQGLSRPLPFYGQVQAQPQTQQTQQPVLEDDLFDEAAFEQAFDQAQQQLQETDAQKTADAPSIHRDGIDIYPSLALLRTRLFQCISEPTEQSMHEAAVLFALLEEHDVSHITPSHMKLFTPLLSKVAYDSALPYSDVYDLRERAQRLMERFYHSTESTQDDSRTAELYTRYIEALQSPSRTSTNQMTSATREDLLSDVKMRLREVGSLRTELRIYNVTSPELNKDAQMSAQANEILNLELQRANESSGLALSLSHESKWRDLWTVTSHALHTAEVLEVNETIPHRTAWVEPQTMSEVEQIQDQPQDTNRDDEELARTAGELLGKVADNQTDKFKNSTFLDLMRRVRDHEVRVRGDKMVEVGSEDDVADLQSKTVLDRPQHGISTADFASGAQVGQDPSGPQDGQAVVDLLNSGEPLGEDPGTSSDVDSPRPAKRKIRFANTWSWAGDES